MYKGNCKFLINNVNGLQKLITNHIFNKYTYTYIHIYR